MIDPFDLLARLSTSRIAGQQLAEEFAIWWTDRDERVHTVLDTLAADAPSSPEALELLLVLIDRHRISRAALRKILITADDVDQADQATLAVVAMKVGQYQQTGRFTTWLHQVASNEAKMMIRARDRRPSTAVDEPPVAPFLARLSTLLANRDVIERALAELPADFRAPLELREIDGLEYEQIAERLDLPIGTVRSRISRARARLVENVRDSGPASAEEPGTLE